MKQDKIDQFRPYIHFHSSDIRCCGIPRMFRQFTINEREVNCPRCLAQTARADHHTKELEAV